MKGDMYVYKLKSTATAGLSTSYQDGANAIQRHNTNFFETR